MMVRAIPCAVAALLVFAACASEDADTQDGVAQEPAATTSSTAVAEGPAFGESEADAVLEYELVDYGFEGPREVEAGKIFFKATNTGGEDHELEVLDGDGEALGEVEAMPPGAEGTLAVELGEGTYTLQCILETADGDVHRDLGMVAELTVG